ncbi:MAG: HD domain-containing protein, partial [Nitrospirae bacterium]|nr:HD domain-containing protein [Nitrospirota bacterium]
PHISLFEVVLCLSKSMDLINPHVVDHHKRVACIALAIASELGLSIGEQNNIVLAALLHDTGALSYEERLDASIFEADNHLSIHKHAKVGYSILNNFSPFEEVAPLILFHHVNFNNSNDSEFEGEAIPLGSYILHIADRVEVLIDKKKDILSQVDGIMSRIRDHSGSVFMPELVDTLERIVKQESFWFDINYTDMKYIVSRKSGLLLWELNVSDLLSLSNLFCQFIDFRSRFTFNHSSGVSACATKLAELVGFSEIECNNMKIAGYFHDIGKLAVPSTILDKRDKLTHDEMNIVKRHVFFTYSLLEPIRDFEEISRWAAFHHERLDGNGYPFHHGASTLSLGSRIMSVADVFTAISEDRPYREGMNSEKALGVLMRMANDNGLDRNIVLMLEKNYDLINAARVTAQNVMRNTFKAYTRYDVSSEIIEKSPV